MQRLLVLVQRLKMPTTVLNCAPLQVSTAVPLSSGRVVKLSVHYCPRSPSIWFQLQHHRRALNVSSVSVLIC